MRRKLAGAALAFLLIHMGPGNPVLAQDAVPLEASELVLGLPEGWYLGEVAGLELNSSGHIFVFHRGSHSLLEFDDNGVFVREIGQGLFRVPHGLRIDGDDNIWTTDQETHQVLQFSPDGRVRTILGRRDISGTGWYDRGYSVALLNAPSDVGFDSQGNIYVADGGNFRVVKYSPHGEFIRSWGSRGDRPGEFDFPHSIVVDGEDRIYVTDRENGRIQIFSTDGEFLSQWQGFGNPYVIQLGAEGSFWLTDARAGRLLHLDGEGRLLGSFGEWGKEIGDFGFPHGFDFAPDGSILVGEILNWRVQRLRLRQ
ncbi:peptidyl-alpha-hydroxyglycine alpha-amidating lyase family protein [Parasphingopyxis marina]|nr:peptidyl-alpha-hydroxyglycine alpha-amidating lyase family protein [Parasphingopyxis marina]